MSAQINYKLSWSNIYSLGLLPAIVIWGLSPFLKEFTIVLLAIILGLGVILFAHKWLESPNGCGIIGWATGWGLLFGGTVKLALMIMGVLNTPITLFSVPCTTLLLYLFRFKQQQPQFCQTCILHRGGIQERMALGDFSRYEVRYILNLILCGGIMVSLLAWGMFIYGIKATAQTGTYFYYYFPVGLCLAILIFEVIRRRLIQYLIESGEMGDTKQLPINAEFVYSTIRVIAIHDNRIYLVKKTDKSCTSDRVEYYDTPLHENRTYCESQEEEIRSAQCFIREELNIEPVNLRHLCSVVAPHVYCRLGHYILFLSKDEKCKMDKYNGAWYSIDEINHMHRKGTLYPLFQEIYARLLTVIHTVLTYRCDGSRRYPKGSDPAISFNNLEKSHIQFDDPIWIYLSRNNEDCLWYRIHKKISQIFSKSNKSKDA